MKRVIVLLVIMFPLFTVSEAQINRYGVPLHSTYSVELSGAAEYNHCMTKDNNGIVYFGNDGRGVIRYDGTIWSLIPVRNKPTLYAIKADKRNIIYLGGNYEFGYLQPLADGSMSYVSLAQRIDTVVNIRIVFSIVVGDDRVVFAAQRNIFTYYPATDSLEVFDVAALGYRNLLTMIPAGDRLFVSDNVSGLLEFTGDSLKPLPGGQYFSRNIITTMIKCGDEELIIGTYENGLYLYNFITGEIDDSFPENGLNERLKQAQIYRGVCLGDDQYAIGTRNTEGVLIIDRKGRVVSQLTAEVIGMDNNVVTAMYADPVYPTELWIATLGFFTKVYLNLPFTYFGKPQGLNSGINTIVSFNNTLYAGNDNGLSKLVTGPQGFPVFKDMPEITSATPVLRVFDNGRENFLIAGTQSGTFMIDAGDRVSGIENSFIKGERNPQDVRKIAHSKVEPDVVYLGVSNGLLKIRYLGNGRWENIRKFPVQVHVTEIEETPDGSIWFSGGSMKWVSRIMISGSDTTIVEYNKDKGLPDTLGFKIKLIDDVLLVGTPVGVFRYNSDNDQFVDANSVFYNFTSGYEVSFLTVDEEGDYWISYREGNREDNRFLEAMIPRDEDRKAVIFHPFSILPIAPAFDIVRYEGRAWLAKSKNVFVVDKEKLLRPEPGFRAFLNMIRVGSDSVIMKQSFVVTGENGRKYPSLDQPSGTIASLAYRFNNVSFYWTSNYYIDEEKTQYSYFLEGNDDAWSRWENLLYKDFSNLKYGQYKFRLKARTITGIESPETVFEFVIQKPWYVTFVAILGYIIAIVAIILGIIKIYTKRLINENIRLEGIVAERTAEVVKQKEELESSIHYASRIQRALLPSEKILSDNLKNYFVLFKPRDIVSGDFYWMTKRSDKLFIVAADCTGHGVPGAFMSLLGMSFLDEIVNKSSIYRADTILKELRFHVTNSLKQVGEDDEAKDGMDLALLVVDFGNSRIEFSGAYNPCFKVRRLADRESGESTELNGLSGEEGSLSNGRYLLEVVSASKMPIGISGRMNEDFVLHEWKLEKGVSYYLFSDGYVDQFGSNGRKFMKKNFKKLLLDIQEYPMKKQKEILEETLNQWMGDTPQIDDILVVGLRTD
ncbi:MAG: hypothetical protein FJY11_00835 [Bacteroidetes bacterium]|nr:hypothetical protein [Bacteroidota bacterium]